MVRNIQVLNRYEVPEYLFTLVRLADKQHSMVLMGGILLIVFSVVFAIGQSSWQDLMRLARERQNADDFVGAESLRWQALRLAEKELGPADKQLAPLLGDLAFSLHFAARDAEAEPLIQRAFSIAKESGDRRLTGLMLNILGIVLSGEGQKARAEPALRRSVALLEESMGAESLDVARAANNLATLYLDTRQYAKAQEEMARALPIYEHRLGSDDPEVAQVSANMFTVLAAQRRATEGEPYLRRALAVGEKAFPESLRMANLQLCLAALEESRENFKGAAVILEKVIATQERLLGPQHPELAHTLAGYSSVLRHMHQNAGAKIALNRANMIRKSALTDVK
jgi:Tetratricopeptide repeat